MVPHINHKSRRAEPWQVKGQPTEIDRKLKLSVLTSQDHKQPSMKLKIRGSLYFSRKTPL